MAGIAARIAEISPATNKGWGITIDPLRESLVGAELRTTALVLSGLVLFILLMACANVANLMLARGAARTREMAVRASLGAGGARLVRQLLTESMLLAALGGAGGLGLAWVLIRIAPRFIPEGGLPAGLALSLDLRVVAFTILVSLGTGLLFGLAPAWQLAKGSLADAMRGGGRGVAAGNSRLLGNARHGGDRHRRHRGLWRRTLPAHAGAPQPGGPRLPRRPGPHHARGRCR